jgi:hypothetical protein
MLVQDSTWLLWKHLQQNPKLKKLKQALFKQLVSIWKHSKKHQNSFLRVLLLLQLNNSQISLVVLMLMLLLKRKERERKEKEKPLLFQNLLRLKKMRLSHGKEENLNSSS